MASFINMSLDQTRTLCAYSIHQIGAAGRDGETEMQRTPKFIAAEQEAIRQVRATGERRHVVRFDAGDYRVVDASVWARETGGLPSRCYSPKEFR